MFHAVPAHLQPRAAMQHPGTTFAMNTAYPATNDATMYQGFPVTLNDGRSVMYLVPPTASPTTPPQPGWAMAAPNGQPRMHMATTAAATQPEHPSPTWMASAFPSGSPLQQQQQQQSPSLASEVRRSPTTPDVPPPYAADKACAAPSPTSATSCGASMPPSSSASLLRPAGAASYNGMSTASAFDVSTTSNLSGVANGSMQAPMLLRAAAAAAPGATPTQQQLQQQPCFCVDSATGTMRAMTAEEVSAMVTGHAAAAAAPAVPSYALAPTGFNASASSLFSASLPGALPYMPVVAMAAPPPPPPPPVVKTMNGLQYVHGELYEGFVKRYNPNRGFGFLTATYHVRPEAEGVSSAAGSPAASLTAAPTMCTSTTPAKERRVPVHLGDIFVHQSYMHMQGFRTLPVGGRVRFRVGYKDGQQTFQAVDVELLPQVVPQGVEGLSASPSSAHASVLPLHSATAAAAAVVAPLSDSEKAVGSPAGSSSDHHSEAERFFFAVPKETGLGRSPVTLTQGESVAEDDEEDSPLIELAYEVYTSLQE